MARQLHITLAQLNPTVGDIKGNIAKLREVYNHYKTKTDLIAFTEMVVTGYPTDDLVLKPFFIDRVMTAVTAFAKETEKNGAALLISSPWRHEGKVYNAALLIYDGKVQEARFKHNLPNYGVFDEVRVFAAGALPVPMAYKGVQLGVLTCEDMWYPEVCAHLKKAGAEILIIPNGSPYEVDKTHIRHQIAQSRVKETGLPLIYINQVGGQDELVFDGASFILDHTGKFVTTLPSHHEHVMETQWKQDDSAGVWHCTNAPKAIAAYEGMESIYQTLTLGLRDYVNKNGFPGVILGMSGGIDSALTAAIAVDALGAERVRCVMMPSPYTSKESLDDAAECSKLLGVKHDSTSIEPAMKAFDEMVKPHTNQNTPGITFENIQARSRGMLLMAISNATGYMVLSTGNKSEMSVGYATLYGDMCGGYNVLKDVYKMTVFALSNWRNQSHPHGGLGAKGRVIPERIITKPPSAELKPGQKDQDSLPPYEDLDDILHCMVELEMGFQAIVDRGYTPETVNKVWKMLDRAEYKRRQACPGVKISSKAFGRDRRYPITNHFTDLIKE